MKIAGKAEHLELQNQTKRVTKNGKTKKEPSNERNGRIPTKRAKGNGGNQTIRYRIQKNGYKDAQGPNR